MEESKNMTSQQTSLGRNAITATVPQYCVVGDQPKKNGCVVCTTHLQVWKYLACKSVHE